MALSHGGTLVAAAFKDHVALWDLRGEKPVCRRIPWSGCVAFGLRFSPNERLLVTTSGPKMRLWNVDTGEPGPEMRHKAGITVIAFTADSSSIASGSDDNTVQLWDTATGSRRGPSLELDESATSLAFSPDGKRVATGSTTRTVQLWDTASGKPYGPPFLQESDITAMTFSPDGRLLVTGGGGISHLWNVGREMHPLGSFSPGARITSVLFSPNSALVLTSTDDQTVRLWNATGGSGGRLYGMPIWMNANAASVLFSADGKLMIASLYDNTARAWDVTTGLQVTPSFLLSDTVQALTISADRKRLITAALDGTVQSFDLPTALPSLDQMERRSWVALDARLNKQGNVEAIPWDEWQRLRDDLQKSDHRGR